MRYALLLLGYASLWGQTLRPPDETFFTQTLYPGLQKAGCAGCHNPDGIASATRLHFPEPGAGETEIRQFGRSLRSLVQTAADKSLLVTKPTRRVPHAGGKRMEPGSAEEAALKSWAAYLIANVPASEGKRLESHTAAAKTGAILRRLTHSQYNNTIRDLLGDDSRIADSFPPEDYVYGFKNQYQSQSISPLLAEAYSAAAEKLAAAAFRDGDKHKLIPCKPASAADAACRDRFIRSFGEKAFRRPLLTAEAQKYGRLFDREAVPRSNFLGGAQIVTEAMLQSPSFLLRTENGAEPQWRPYETAARLSYFLWNSLPDEELLKAARGGELSTPAGLEKRARLMLADPRARTALDEFVSQWLRFDRLLSSVKDRRLFPQWNLDTALAMTEETRRLASDLIWSNSDFMKFYSADYTFPTTQLAELYGLPAPAAEYQKTPVPPETERAGVLGHALFLALTSKPSETSPTARGLFVREQFLCQEVPQPPPGVAANLPPLAEEKPQTNRQRLGVHLSSESCASCHNLIDPIGFGFEKFDAIGKRREKLQITFGPGRRETREPKTVELPLDTSGEIAGIQGSRFTSPREIGNILAANVQCQECVVKQLFRYAMGRHEKASDRVVIRQVFADFRDSGFKFQELAVSLMKWTEFSPEAKGSDGVTGN